MTPEAVKQLNDTIIGMVIAFVIAVIICWYVVPQMFGSLSTVWKKQPRPAAEAPPTVMSSVEPALLLMVCSFLYFHAQNGGTERKTEPERNGNERDISAGRRAEIKKMLDTERTFVPPDKWMNKTRFRTIVGGNATKAGELYDELQRELDAVEIEGLNAALST